uniref:Cytochrome P450 CYP72A616 n=1 Tax=Paris polyphylla TaxID=49666 RepID=72A61_PARPY|nr:RecName: Full=Cytochrome P450 CYP72A616; Short=PpCYP72A616 [Paris polyphylla]QDS03631.1 cytochrome P450 CYP72A616 [Paris polyphylla]
MDSRVLGALAALLAAAAAWVMRAAAEWLWWRPRRLERSLRSQGVDGNLYRFLNGDLKETVRLTKEARAQPISPPSHRFLHRINPLLLRAISHHGKFALTWIGPTPRVSIMDPELVREVLSNKFGHFAKPKAAPIVKLLATGLANYEGEKWVRHRRIINPAFHLEKLKRMLPAFFSCCSELIGRWESLVGCDESREVDVWPELQNLTGDVISRTAFGSSYAEGRRIFQLQSEQAELLIQAVQTVYIPGYRFLPTPKNIRRTKIDKEVRALLRSIIEKRENAMKMGDVHDDLLGLLMEYNLKESEHFNSKNIGMTTEDVIEECKLFYFAGQETTSVLLTWTMILLGMHPSWQDRAREEVSQVFGKNKPDFDGLSRLKTVTMILYEVLRLYPPIIFLTRRTYKPMMLGGITFPPEVQLALPIIFIHHDPEFWGEDAEEFNPDRFADGVSKASKNQMAFFPFGWGPRICIGQGFAMLEAKMGLSMILQRFSFELSPNYSHAPHTKITLQPQHGAQMVLHRL